MKLLYEWLDRLSRKPLRIGEVVTDSLYGESYVVVGKANKRYYKLRERNK